jgi:hydroxymethylpyrimidine/phosphomethylpyrimidine kinase
MSSSYPRVLIIAGSDSGGGAGIQADIKSISACGGFAMTAITALTAQNTQSVQAIHGAPLDIIQKQIGAVAEDIGVDAVKIGMLHSTEVIEVVAAALDRYGLGPVVLDPVMVAKSGDRLLEREAIAALQESLLPKAELITPNLPEAEVLLGRPIDAEEHFEEAARQLSTRFGPAVLLKGGHLPGQQLLDVLYEPTVGAAHRFGAEKIATGNTHGTGCTLSSAIAAHRARGLSLAEAVAQGIAYTREAIRQGQGKRLGQGSGPVHHFFAFEGRFQ